MFRISTFTMITFSSFAVVAFYLPLYLQYKGLSNSEIGFAMGLGSLVTILGQPVWGLISDRMKTIKKVLVFILCFAALSSVPMFMADTFLIICLFLVVFMFFFTSVGPLTESLMISFSYEHNRNYGSIRLWGEVGVGTAALWLGLSIERAGMGILGWLYLGMVLVVLLYMFWLPDARSHSIPVTKQSLKKLFANRRFLLFLGLLLLVSVPHRMNDTFLPIYLKQLGATESDVGTAWLIATLSAVPTMALIGRFLQRYSELVLVAIACFFYALRWVIYSLASDSALIMLGQALHLLTFPIVLIASVQLVFKMVPRELIATGQTIFTAVFFGIGGILGSSVGGSLIDIYGAGALYLTGAGLCVLGGAMLLLCRSYLYGQQAASGSKDTTLPG